MTARAPRLLVACQGGVARLTLNRPAKLNSLDRPIVASLIEALEALRADAAIRCVVLAGAGRAFCAGQDLEERRPVVEGVPLDLGDALDAGINRLVRLISALPQPVVCAVQGPAAGAGASLALACDLLVAAKTARFVFSFARIGLVPDGGATWTLPRRVGAQRAAGLALLGGEITGAEAAEWGLVWRAVEPAALAATVDELAHTLAERSPHAARLAKRALRASWSNDLDAQLDLERDLQREAGFTPEYRAAVARFLGKAR